MTQAKLHLDRRALLSLGGVSLLALSAPGLAATGFGPSGWPAGEWDRWWAIQADAETPRPEGKGRRGIVSTAYNGLATRVGLEALKQGGSSVDAALATAMAQITLDAGAAISFAGIMTMMHYEAATGRTHVMNAAWNTVKGETDPASIPAMQLPDAYSGTPSGRTALVPGFMKGVEAAHRRFGKLPFASLFQPSIEIAEKGFPVYPEFDSELARRSADLGRLPASRAVFFKPDGKPYSAGDLFRQPALAATLRAVAASGAAHMYTGHWAKRLVAAVQADGGKLTLDDLAAYDVIWSDPIRARYGTAELLTMGGPGKGGLNLVEALNLATSAGMANRPHWSKDGESLRRLALVTAPAAPLTYTPAALAAPLVPGVDLSREARMTQANADKLWAALEAGTPLATLQKRSNHSDVVVVADAKGNMTAICHSINCVFWGKTGIVVDGITIGDPAAHQQAIIQEAGPGQRLPDPTCVGMLVKDGRPTLAFSSMGAGLHHKTVQCLLNSIDFGMSPKEATDAPTLLFPEMNLVDGKVVQSPRVGKGEFSPAVLQASGLQFTEVGIEQLRTAQGIWIGVERTADGSFRANAPRHTSGFAEGF